MTFTDKDGKEYEGGLWKKAENDELITFVLIVSSFYSHKNKNIISCRKDNQGRFKIVDKENSYIVLDEKDIFKFELMN